MMDGRGAGRIVACGEALIDMLPRETTRGEAAFAPYAGGAVFNTAIALGRLGEPAGFLSGLSSDLFGDLLRSKLAEAGVDTSLSVVTDRPTTMAFVRLTDGHASYTFYDEQTSGRMLTEADLPAIPDDLQALYFGSISLVGEPCGTAYEALQSREAPRRVTMLDPNIRTTFIRDEAAFRARMDRMMARADIVKSSDEDLAWLMGDGDPEALAKAVLAKGPKVVCVTMGGDGAIGVTARDTVRVAAPRVTVADTVGAGDTFNAGLLAGLNRLGRLDKASLAALSAADLESAMTLAAKAAAVTVSRPGADPPWAREIA